MKNSINNNKGRLLFYIAGVAFPVLQFIVFYVIVNARSILFAFQRYDMTQGYYLSFSNFEKIFASEQTSMLLKACSNSLMVYLIHLVFGTGLGIVFSNYIYKKNPGHKLFQIILFLPQILSVVVMAPVFRFFVDEGVPQIMKIFGYNVKPLLSNADTRLLFMVIFTLWSSYGVSVLMYTSTMSGIDTSIVESAQLDGITPMKEFIFITVPCIFPTIISFIVIGLAEFFVRQENIYTFYGEGPLGNDKGIMTIGYFVYASTRQATGHMNYDQYTFLSALGLILSAIAIPVTLGVRKLLEKYGPSVD